RVPDEKRRVVRDFRMLREEGRERRVGRQVVLLRDERRVDSEHLTDRWRILAENLVQPLTSLPRVPFFDRRCGRLGRSRRRLGEARGWQTAQERGHERCEGCCAEGSGGGTHYLPITRERSRGSRLSPATERDGIMRWNSSHKCDAPRKHETTKQNQPDSFSYF